MDWPEKAWDAGKVAGALLLGVLSLLGIRLRKRSSLSLALDEPDLADLERRVGELEAWKQAAEDRREERVKELEGIRNVAENAAADAVRIEEAMLSVRGIVSLELQGIQKRIDDLLYGLAQLPGKRP